MNRPDKIITEKEYNEMKAERNKTQLDNYNKGRMEFESKKTSRQNNTLEAKKGAKTLSGIDNKYSHLISLLDMKSDDAKSNLRTIAQQIAMVEDADIVEALDQCRIQSELDIEELSGQKVQIADAVASLDSKLDELLLRYGSGIGNMGKPQIVNDNNAVAAIGSPSNTYNPNNKKERDAAYDKALWGSTAAKLGVSPSVMKEL